jgi:glycosyltransferase involved in cell wall biosynthesis
MVTGSSGSTTAPEERPGGRHSTEKVAGPVPLVSVIVPTRDRAHLLETSLASVLEGSYERLELLVIDDASTDDTAEVVRSLAGDGRLRYQRLDTPVGAAAARNVGIEQARGELIAFQDSDDTWTHDHLDVLVGAFADAGQETVATYGVMEMFGGERVPGPAIERRTGDLRHALPRHNFIGLPAVLVRGDAIGRVGGFDRRLRRLQDWDLFLGLVRLGGFRFIDRVVVLVGGGPDRISGDQEAYYQSLQLILDRHADLFTPNVEWEIAHRMQLVRHYTRRRQPGAVARQLVSVSRRPAGLLRWSRARVRGVSPVARRTAP